MFVHAAPEGGATDRTSGGGCSRSSPAYVWEEPETPPPECGDGVVDREQDEQCDDGEVNGRIDACTDLCQLPTCGDGLVNQSDEECDDTTDSCTQSCKFLPPNCGDGVLNEDEGEECDDGNDINTDACVGCITAVCGDGLVWDGQEECDDGNDIDTDDCLTTCTPATCGDGVTWTDNEECDDGEETAMCDADCTLPVCGDNIANMAAGEECDGGMMSTKECDGDGKCTIPKCGDGFHNEAAGEECDDGMMSTATCDGNGQCTVPKCGDGFHNAAAGEECDDGNPNGGDGCSAECIEERLVFITSIPYKASDLGGLVGADGKCDDLASTAGLAGTYLAWLSDNTGSPSSRFPKDFSGPYVLTDGTAIAIGWEQLTSGSLITALAMNEAMEPATNLESWSNTLPNGTTKNTIAHCENWSSNMGNSGAGFSTITEGGWTDNVDKPCAANGGAHIYCFQVSP